MGRPDDKSNARVATPAMVAASAGLLVTAVVVGVAFSWIAAALPALLAAVVGAMTLRSLVGTAKAPAIDAFAVGEPWRQYVQRSLRSERELSRIVSATADGPLRERLSSIADRLAIGVHETWRIAQRGDALDDAIRRLDPVALRARLDHLRGSTSSGTAGTDMHAIGDPATSAVQSQLDSVERLQQQSSRTSSSLQLSQLRVEELVARSAEVSMGGADTEVYAHDVEDLVIELEALRLATDEIDNL